MAATSFVAHTKVSVTDGGPALNEPFVGKTVSMQAEVNGRYVSAADEGNSPLIADPAEAKQWELFDVVAGIGHDAFLARALPRARQSKESEVLAGPRPRGSYSPRPA